MAFANIVVSGNIGADAETKTAGQNTVTEFRMATSKKNRNGEDQTTWFTVNVWGKRGEGLAPSLRRGTAILVSGDFTTREYMRKDGNKAVDLVITLDKLEFLDRASGGTNGARASTRQTVEDDGDVPF